MFGFILAGKAVSEVEGPQIYPRFFFSFITFAITITIERKEKKTPQTPVEQIIFKTPFGLHKTSP